MKRLKYIKFFDSYSINESNSCQVSNLINEYKELQPDIESSKENNFIFINSISEVPKVGKPMDQENFKRDGISSLSWDNIVVVRATNEVPIINKRLMILPTCRSLKTIGWGDEFIKTTRKKWENDNNGESWNEYFKNQTDIYGNRWTKHFTLNHLVEDNTGGSWINKSFVMLLPGKEMVSLNGKPSSLYVIDTWYSKNVVIPKNTVVLYSPEVRNKVEQMSFEFNRDLNGEKLKYPVYFLEINSKDEVNDVIQAMGYSVVKGGAYHSTEDVEEEFRDFVSSENQVSMGPHSYTFWSDLEQNGKKVSIGNLLKNLEHLQNSIKDDNVLNKWYEDHRRIIKSYLDILFRQEKEEGLIRSLEQLKNSENQYNRIYKFKTDVIKSLKKNNVKYKLDNW